MRMTPSNLKSIRFDVQGLEEYTKRIQQAGRNVDEYVKRALEESVKPIHQEITKWAEAHELTGATVKGVSLSDVKRDGGRFYVEIGIDTSQSKLAWHAVFVEYGTPRQPADPGIRRAFGQKARVKKIQLDVLKKGGIPLG